jgi:hypothetical protein
MPRWPRIVAACVIGAAAAAGVAGVLASWARLGTLPLAIASRFPLLVELLTASIGVWMVDRHWPRRFGGGPHCKRCGYHRERHGRLVDACPECGAPWLWIGMTRTGGRSGDLPLAALGAALVAFSLGAMLVQAAAPWVYLRMIPTATLLGQVAVLPDRYTGNMWGEVMRRRLPAATLDGLAPALMAKRVRDGALSLAAEAVLFDAMTRPGAPALLTAPYFKSIVSGEVAAPESVREGEMLRIAATAGVRTRPMTYGAPPRMVVCSATFVGDSTEPVGRWTWEIAGELPPPRREEVEIEARAAGSVTVRQVFWLALGPAGAGDITWAGGAPVLPPTMLIRDQFERATTVIVEPRRKRAEDLPPAQPR